MARSTLPLRTTTVAPRYSLGRFALALVVSVACHLLLVAPFLAHTEANGTGPAMPSTIVLVDLPPVSEPLPDAPVVLPVDGTPEEAPARSDLSRRLVALAEENAALSAGLAEERRRTAQLEADYRRQIASFEVAAGALGQEAAALAADNAALAAQIESGRARTAGLEEKLARRQAAQEAEAAEMQRAHDRLVAALRDEIADKDVALDAANRRLTVSIVERVLFPSGQATLTPEGEPIIDRIGSVLRALPEQFILVEGHTDNVPIGAVLRARFPSNWELSAARAAEVVRRLIDHGDVESDRLRAAGRADTRPVAENDTENGRRRNRRIEIILLPQELAEANPAS